MTRFNALNLLRNAMTGHKNWTEQWPDSQPKAEYARIGGQSSSLPRPRRGP